MKRSFPIILIMAASMLMACQKPLVLSESQVASLADGDLCNLYRSNRTTEDNTWAALSAQIKKRKLDCSEEHRKCTEYGFRKGTKKYGECRLEIERLSSEERINDQRIKAEQKQVDSMMGTLQQMQNNQHSHENMRSIYSAY